MICWLDFNHFWHVLNIFGTHKTKGGRTPALTTLVIVKRFFHFTKFFLQKSYTQYAIKIFLTIFILKMFYCHDFEKVLQKGCRGV